MKIQKNIDSGLFDLQKYDNYDTNKSQDSQLNSETNLDKMKNLNIG